jgi:hypothetical protein
MAKVLNKYNSDTPIPSGTVATLTVDPLNFGTDFRRGMEKGTSSSSSATVMNVTTPTSFPESFRFEASAVTNVYNNTSIEKTLYAPTKMGASVLCSLDDVWTVTDTEDPSYCIALPMHAHLVLRVPNNENLTSSDVRSLICRLLGGLFESGSDDNSRISALLRGAVLPKDM